MMRDAISFANVLLWIAAITFLGSGLAFLIAPVPLANLVEIPLVSPTAWVDFLATYGGLQLGLGVFLLICALRTEAVAIGLIASGFALAGFALGRLYGLASAHGTPSPIIYGYLSIELAGAVIAFWAALSTTRPVVRV